MAKSKKTNSKDTFDDIDDILSGLEDGDIDIQDDKGDERSAISKVAKNVKTGFVDSFKSNPADKLANFADNAMPRSLSQEYTFVKDTAKEVKEVYEKSAKEIKAGVKSTVDIVKEKISQDSKLYKMLNGLSNKLDTEKSYKYNEPSEDEIISGTLTELFSKGRKIDEITDKVKDIKENKKFEKSTLQNNAVITNLEKLNDFHNTYTLAYYKKTIELKLKSLFLNKELLELTRKSSEANFAQFEAIIKNTSLPDLIKLRNNEQFKETLKVRSRENMADMFLATAKPLEVLKNNIVKKIGDTATNIKDGLAMGLNSYEMSSNGMVSKGEMAGDFAGNILQEQIANFVGQKLEESPYIKKYLKKIKLAAVDPSETFYDLAGKAEDKNTFMSRGLARLYRGLGFMSQTTEVENKRFREGAPDEETYFDYKTKNSISKIIPSLLGKIYGEVRSIRTGEAPVSIYYDYSTGKLEETNSIESRVSRKIDMALQSTAGTELDNFLDMIDSGGNIKDKGRGNIKASLLSYLAKNGSINPKALLKDEFLSTLSKRDRKAFRKHLSSTIDTENDDVDVMTLNYLSDSLYSIKTNTPHIDKLVEEFYNNGQIEEVLRTGLVTYDEINGTYSIDKKNYDKLLRKLINKKNELKSKKQFDENATSPDMVGGFKDFVKDGKESIKNNKYFKSMNSKFKNNKHYKDAMSKVKGNEHYKKYFGDKDTKAGSYNAKDNVFYMGNGSNAYTGGRGLVPYSELIEATIVDDTISEKLSKNKYYQNIKNKFGETDEFMNRNKHYRDLKSKFNKTKDSFENVFKRNTKAGTYNAKDNVFYMGNGKGNTLPTIYNGSNSDSDIEDVEVFENPMKGKELITEVLGSNRVSGSFMYKAYKESKEFLNGIDFHTWVRNLGYAPSGGSFFKMPEDLKMSKLKEKVNEHFSKYVNGMTGAKEKFKGLKGLFGVKLGMTPLQMLHSVLNTTRRWDRKVMKSIPRAIGKIFKTTFNIGKGITKFGFKGLFNRNTMNFMRVLVGLPPIYEEKKDGGGFFHNTLSKILNKTRGWDKGAFKNAPGFIKKLFKGAGKGSEIAGKAGLGSKAWNFAKVMFGFAPTVENEHADSDDDGDRDGSWEDRFNKSKDKDKGLLPAPEKKEKEKKSLFGFLSFFKDKLMLIPGILTGLLGKVKLLSWLPKIGTGLASLLGFGGKALRAGATIGKTAWNGAKVVGGALLGKKVVANTALDALKLKTVLNTQGAAATAGAITNKAVGKSKIMDVLNSFKDRLLKKLGPKAGAGMVAKLMGKIAARAVPIAGTALLAYDAGMIAADMFKNGTSLESAISKQILGFDLFNDDAPVVDEEGNPIKPDEQKPDSSTNPNLDEYVKELIKVSKKEIETGIRDEEGRAKLASMKDKYKLEDKDIIKHYNATLAFENKDRKNNSDLEAIKRNAEAKAKASTYKPVNSGNRFDHSYNGIKGNTHGASTAQNQSDLINGANGNSNYTNTDMEGINVGSKFGNIKGKEGILAMLDEVAKKTGVDAAMLKTFAAIESNFETKAKAGTSSAGGLFQFINSTWNSMLQKYGPKYGIPLNTSKFDPYANSIMGAEYLKENRARLSSIKRGNSVTDLYLAHFLGPGGARALLSAHPNTIASKLLPEAAAANYNVFFDKATGRPRTVAGIVQWANERIKSKMKAHGMSVAGNTESEIPKATAEMGSEANEQVSNTETGVNLQTNEDNANSTATKNNATDVFSLNSKKATPMATVATVSTVPEVSQSSASIVDNGEASTILNKSLLVQMDMAKHLKGIYDLVSSGRTLNPLPSIANNKEMTPSIMSLEKKRF